MRLTVSAFRKRGARAGYLNQAKVKGPEFQNHSSSAFHRDFSGISRFLLNNPGLLNLKGLQELGSE
jgi:hypothetical protein